jgi:hypothetical protein
MQAFVGVDGHTGVRHGRWQLCLLEGQPQVTTLAEEGISAVSSLPQRVSPPIARSKCLLLDP